MRTDVLRERLDASFVSSVPWEPGGDGDALVTADLLHPVSPYGHLYQYLLHTGFIVPLR